MKSTFAYVYTVNRPDRKLRLSTLAYGLLLFIWLTPEDNHLLLAAGLGVGAALLLAAWVIRRRIGGMSISLPYAVSGAVLVGAIVGLSAGLATAGLMFFKNALHAHVFWDYPPAMIAALLARTPWWGAAGALAGLGCILLWVWNCSRIDSMTIGEHDQPAGQ